MSRQRLMYNNYKKRSRASIPFGEEWRRSIVFLMGHLKRECEMSCLHHAVNKRTALAVTAPTWPGMMGSAFQL